MSVSIAALKEYMHAEGEADATIASYLAMAEAYLAGAGITEALATAEGYGLAAKALTLHYYDHRGGAPIPEGLQDYIRQQQCLCRAAAAAAVSESDAEEEAAAAAAANAEGEGDP